VPAQVAGIDLGHDERHVQVVAPGRGIIDHDAALRRDPRRPFLRDRAAGRHQANIRAGEVVGLEHLAFQGLVAERDLRADRARGGERDDLGDRKLPLGEDVQHLAPDIARCAHDGDLEPHDLHLADKLAPLVYPALPTRQGKMQINPLATFPMAK
jgi:hypothetical protein